MKKLLTLILSMYMVASAYALSIYSENFDSWAVEADGADVLSAAGQGWTWYAERYTSDGDYIPDVGYYPGSEPVSHIYSVTGTGGANADAKSGNALSFNGSYGSWETYHDRPNTVHRYGMTKQVLTVTQDMIDAGSLVISASVKSLGNANGIHNSDVPNNDGNSTTLTNGGIIAILGKDGNQWAAETISVNHASDGNTWNDGSITYSLDQGALGAYLNLNVYSEIVNWSASAIVVDDISVSAVPEPSTYALIAGFAAFVFVAIRRRK
jgi:hypothetical protein